MLRDRIICVVVLIIVATFSSSVYASENLICGTKLPFMDEKGGIHIMAGDPGQYLTGLPNSVTTTNFTVHYDRTDATWPSAAIADQFAQTVSNTAENAYTQITGYFNAPPDPDRIDIAIREIPAPAGWVIYGDAWDYNSANDDWDDLMIVEDANGDPVPEDLLIRIDITAHLQGQNILEARLHSTVTHEFFHCVHAGYDWHFDFGDANDANAYVNSTQWIEEGSCEWIVDEVYDAEDVVIGRINSFLEDPDDVSLTSASYRAVLYWRFLSEKYRNSGDASPGWWIMREAMREIDSDEPATPGGAIDSVEDALVTLDQNHTFEKSFARQECARSTYGGLAGQSVRSYFTRANYLNDHEYEEGANYDDIRLYDGTFNPTPFDGSQWPSGNQNVKPWATDYFKIEPTAGAETLSIGFDGDNNSDFIVKVVLIDHSGDSDGDNVKDCWLLLDSDRKGIFSILESGARYSAANDAIVIIVARTSTDGNGNYEITLSEPATQEDIVQASINAALHWLCWHQNADGSWGTDVRLGVTELVTLALFNYGVTEDDAVDSDGDGTPDIQEAMNYILSYVQADGGIYQSSGVANYETSMGILVLVAADQTNIPSKYTNQIANAKDFLLGIQNVEGAQNALPSASQIAEAEVFLSSIQNDLPTYQMAEAQAFLSDIQPANAAISVSPDDQYYGGWSYYPWAAGYADHSNTQWSLMGLSAAYSYLGLAKPNPNTPGTWTSKALKFLERCQNYATNDQPWAGDDGGFVYVPYGGTVCGPSSTSYGSMTYAGIWSMLLIGLNVADPRVQAALDWAESNFSVTSNPPACGDTVLYYYYISMAKALAMAGQIQLGGYDWFQELSTELVNRQHPEGYWQNTGNSWLQEGQKALATAYALLSIETRTLAPGADLWMSIILASNADLHVYDPDGRHVGKNYVTGEIEVEIPGATFEEDAQGRQIIDVNELEAGNYRVELVGTGDGEYSLTVDGYRDENVVSSTTFSQDIQQGDTHVADVIVGAIAGALTIYVEEPKQVPGGLVATPGDTVTNLTWSPIVDDDLLGYRVYYGTASRSYGAPIDVGNVTSYQLTGLTNDVTYYIAVTAYYTGDRESGYSVEVTAIPTEQEPPVVSGIPDVSFVEGGSDSSIDLDDYVDDPDNTDAEMTWTYTGNTHVNVAIADTHVVTFTAEADWDGSETITFTATDPAGASGSDDMIVTVIPLPPPVVSDIPDVSFNEDGSDSSIDLDDYVDDADNTDAEITWTASGNTNVIVNIASDTHVVTFTALPDWNGSEVITFTATDPAGASGSDTMTVTVIPIPDLVGASYRILTTTLTLEFDMDMKSSPVSFDGMGMELDNSGKWDLAMSDARGLSAEAMLGNDKVMTVDINRDHVNTVNLAVAYLVIDNRVDLLLREGAFISKSGEKVSPVIGTDNMKLTRIPAAGDVSGDGSVTAYDAALILRSTVSGQTVFPIYEAALEISELLVAYGYSCDVMMDIADISGNGELTAYDAALTLRQAVGLTALAPIVSNSPRKCRLNVDNYDDQRLNISIDLDNVGDVYSADVIMIYDPQVLAVADVSETPSISGWLSEQGTKPGKLRISLAGASQPVADGSLVTISFDVGRHEGPLWDAIKQLNIAELKLNDGMLTAIVENLPKDFALLQNYPNPFNPETWIPYQLSEPADVTISIYNVNGQMVRQLVLGSRMPGHYTDKSRAAYWDGTNELGERVSSGVYFYQLQASGDASVRKMIIVK